MRVMHKKFEMTFTYDFAVNDHQTLIQIRHVRVHS